MVTRHEGIERRADMSATRRGAPAAKEAKETRRTATVTRNRARASVVSSESDDAQRGLPRSDSAMTLRGASAKTPRRAEAGGDRPEAEAEDEGARETTTTMDAEDDAVRETTAAAAAAARAPERRWYRMVKMHDHGVCTTAVADAELAMLEASILRSAVPSGCEGMVVGGGAGAGWNADAPCSSGEEGARGRWAPDDVEYEEECAVSGGFVGGAQDDSASAWERGGVASVAHVTTHATTNAVASNGHMKPGGPCDHCGAVDSPQWRRGPASKPMLCNACGTRYRRTNSLGPAPSSRMATPEKRKNVAQNDARGKKNARCAVGGDNGKFSRARAVVF